MRMLPSLAALALVSCGGPRLDAFIPDARQPFDGFIALNPPQENVPVGAEWVDGQGAVGPGANADNLETVRGLSSISIDRTLEGELSTELINFLLPDSKMRGHATVRLTDLSVVRVKDTGKLPRTSGRRRIIEALKAGEIMITSSSSVGINSRKASNSPIAAVTASGARSRSYSIKGQNLFIAIRLAS